MRKKTESLLYSAGGLVAALIILVLLNLVLGAVRGRIDLTQGKLYTLSEGTRAILGKLESPVKIRLYFSQSEVPLPIKAYGRRVEDLLAEFRQAGRGKVTVEKLDPQPDSDAEDSATLEGVEAQVTPSGDKFYLGASISYADQKLALPALTPDREPLLEYDLVRAIARAAVSSSLSSPRTPISTSWARWGAWAAGARRPRSTDCSRPGAWASTRGRSCSTCVTSRARERAPCRRSSRSTTMLSIRTTSPRPGSGRCSCPLPERSPASRSKD